MTSAQTISAFWAFTLTTAKESVRLYFDPLKRFVIFITRHRVKQAVSKEIPVTNEGPSCSHGMQLLDDVEDLGIAEESFRIEKFPELERQPEFFHLTTWPPEVIHSV